jgi:hypothetical protein
MRNLEIELHQCISFVQMMIEAAAPILAAAISMMHLNLS